MVRFYGLAALASLASVVSAQTSSECNPLKTKCPDNPSLPETWNTDFKNAKSLGDNWKLANQGTVTFSPEGANLAVVKQGDNPTLESTGYYLFGSLDVRIKASPGTGIVTSIVMLSDDLDEVDWELIGGNTGQVQSNYFGKGDTSTYDRAAWHNIANPQGQFHNYKVDWTPTTITWYIDGAVVRTLNYPDALGGSIYPQTPMKVRIGIWAGGDPTNTEGTIGWAGGRTDYSKGPYTMIVESVNLKNYSPGKSYSWSDNSGSYQSIKIDGGKLMGSTGSSGTTSSATTMSTSLSKAAPIPTNPLASVDNKPSNATISVAAASSKPTGTGATGASSTGAASHLEAKAMGAVGGLLALAMALFA